MIILYVLNQFALFVLFLLLCISLYREKMGEFHKLLSIFAGKVTHFVEELHTILGTSYVDNYKPSDKDESKKKILISGLS